MIDFEEVYPDKLRCQSPAKRVISRSQYEGLVGCGCNAFTYLPLTERLPVGKGLKLPGHYPVEGEIDTNSHLRAGETYGLCL
jgi:hypothetical protein